MCKRAGNGRAGLESNFANGRPSPASPLPEETHPSGPLLTPPLPTQRLLTAQASRPR